MAIDRVSTLRNAEKLIRQGKFDQAIAEYVRLVDDQPDDWTSANALGDLYVRNAQSDKAVEQFTRIADSFLVKGFVPKAAALYKKILKIKPDAEHALSKAAEIAIAQGLLVDARAYLNQLAANRRKRGDAAGAAEIAVRIASLDPNDIGARLAGARTLVAQGLLADAVAAFLSIASDLAEKGDNERRMTTLEEGARAAAGDLSIQIPLLEAFITAGRMDDAVSVVERLVMADPASIPAIADAAHRALPSDSVAAYRTIAAAAEASVGAGRFAEGIAAYEAWLDRAPSDVVALSRVIELAVDAGLDEVVTRTQARLADTHIAAGRYQDARFIAEDLVLRNPDEREHQERVRQVRRALGQPDAEETEAAPQVSEVIEPPAPATEEPAATQLSQASVSPAAPMPVPPQVVPPPPAAPRADFSRAAPIAQAQHRSSGIEVDLSVVLDEIRKPIDTTEPPVDLDDVFAQLREQARRRQMESDSEQEFKRGISLFRAGQIEEAIPALEAASRMPRFRFDTAAILGRIYLRRGHLDKAVEWLERAAEAPPRTPADGHAVLYDLADTLESVGDNERALAVYLQLHADAGPFRDVPERVTRLSGIRTRR